MKILFLILFSLSLHASMGSSVNIPAREHLKYAFGNHKNHPAQKIEEAQYYRSLAKMDEIQIKKHLVAQGYVIHDIELRDIASELVYHVYVSNESAKRFVLYVDPTNGSILKTEPLK
jgi:uncharacterized membrane protein YkoI